MKSDNYKHFKEGDCIVCIKSSKSVYSNLFNSTEDGLTIQLYKIYTFDKYLTRQDGGIIYDALVLKGLTPLHDEKNFMLLSEFRKLKLEKLKRKLYFKNLFNKFVNIK